MTSKGVSSFRVGGGPDPYRKYLLGHAPSREALVSYTHLPQIRRHYLHAIETELTAPLAILRQRGDTMGTAMIQTPAA